MARPAPTRPLEDEICAALDAYVGRNESRWSPTLADRLPTSAPQSTPAMQRLRSVFEKWLLPENSSKENHWFYGLTKEYKGQLSLRALEGQDRLVAESLRQIASDLDVDVFLTTIEKKESGNCEDDESEMDGDEDIPEEDKYVCTFHDLYPDSVQVEWDAEPLVDLQGRIVAQSLYIYEHTQNLMRGKIGFFDGVEAEESDFEPGEEPSQYRHDCLAYAVHTSRISAIIMVRRASTANFLVSCTSDNDDLILLSTYLADEARPNGFSSRAMKTLQSFCSVDFAVLDERPYGSSTASEPAQFGSESAGVVYKTLLEYQEGIFAEHIINHFRLAPDLAFFHWLGNRLDTLGSFPIDGANELSIPTPPGLWQSLAALDAVVTPNWESRKSIRSSSERIFRQIVTDAANLDLGEQDARELLSLKWSHRYGVDVLKDVTMPLVRSKLASQGRISFTLVALQSIQEQLAGASRPAEAKTVFFELALPLMNKLADVSNLHGPRPCPSPQEAKRHRGSSPVTTTGEPALHFVRPQLLFDFVWRLYLNHRDLLGFWISYIDRDAHRIPENEFHHLWLPFLHCLFKKHEAGEVNVAETPWQGVVFKLFLNYTRTYVGKEPRNDINTVTQLPCDCAECQNVNIFLASQRLQSKTYRLKKERCAHVQSMFRVFNMQCTVEVTNEEWYFSTLRITKEWKRNGEMRKSWEARAATAISELFSFDEKALHLVMGEIYPSIMGLQHLRADRSAFGAQGVISGQAREPLRAMPGNVPGVHAAGPYGAQPGASGIKRKASYLYG